MKRTLILSIIAGVLLSSSGAFSQQPQPSFNCPERPNNPTKARKIAGTMFSEAEEAFDQEVYDKALEKFVCSLVMVEHQNTVINIERTLAEMTDKGRAVEILKSYIAAGHADGETKSKMEELVAASEAAANPQPAAENTTVCPTQETLPPEPCPAPPEPVLEIDFKHRAQKLAFAAGWAGVGVGAASFVTAVVFQALASSAKNQAQSAVDYDVFLDERDKNKTFQTAAATLFISSVLTSAVGVAELFLLSEQQKKYELSKHSGTPTPSLPPQAKPAVSFTPSIGQVGMEVTF